MKSLDFWLIYASVCVGIGLIWYQLMAIVSELKEMNRLRANNE